MSDDATSTIDPSMVVKYLTEWIHGSMGWADDADVEALVAACRLIEAAYPKAGHDE